MLLAGTNWTVPLTSQSPAVSDKLVQFPAEAEVRLDPLELLLKYSPTLPALALFAAVVPTMPAVVDGVIAPVAASVPVDIDPDVEKDPAETTPVALNEADETAPVVLYDPAEEAPVTVIVPVETDEVFRLLKT